MYECRLNMVRLYGPEKSPERGRHPFGGGGNLFLLHLALRAALQQPPQYFLKHSHFLHSKHDADIAADEYEALLGLTANLQHLDLAWNAATALFLLGCLDRSGYLESILDEKVKTDCEDLMHFEDGRKEVRVFFCYLLFHLYAVIQCNNHGIQG